MEVLALLERSVRVEGIRYPWKEYLLRVAKGGGYRWLSESKGHWILLEPANLGEVGEQPGTSATFRGVSMRTVSSVMARARAETACAGCASASSRVRRCAAG